MVEPLSLNFRVFTVKLVGVRKFRNFTVLRFSMTVKIVIFRLKTDTCIFINFAQTIDSGYMPH